MVSALLRRIAYLRYLFSAGAWRWVGARIDSTVTDHLHAWAVLRPGRRRFVHPTVSFRCPENVVLGDNTRVQPHCCLWASPNSSIEIGEHSGIGPGTMIFSSNHTFAPDRPYHVQPWVEKGVRIGTDVWVGAGSVILPGVTIGDGCVVAAGSVVTKDVPRGSVAAGVPARVLRQRAEAGAGSAE